MIVEVIALAVIVGGYLYAKKRGGLKSVVAAKGTAFARLAEQEGKVVALKAASKIKAEEAKAIHAGLDEFDKLIG